MNVQDKLTVDLTNVSMYNYAYILSISILYPYFFSKFADIIFNKKDIDTKYYKNFSFGRYDFNEKNKQAYDDFNTKKYVLMIVVGIAGIIAGTHYANTNRDGGAGIALGGLFSLIYYTLYNWMNINEYIKLLISGGSLAILLHASTIINFRF